MNAAPTISINIDESIDERAFSVQELRDLFRESSENDPRHVAPPGEDSSQRHGPSAECRRYLRRLLGRDARGGDAVLRACCAGRGGGEGVLGEEGGLVPFQLSVLSSLLSAQDAPAFRRLLPLVDPTDHDVTLVSEFFARLAATLHQGRGELTLVDVYAASLARRRPLLLDLLAETQQTHLQARLLP